MADLLEVNDVRKRFGGLLAVAGATFGVSEGSITALIGPNGAGKTTLFNVLTGFYRGDGGTVRFASHDVSRHRPYAIARLGMVRTFQITRPLGGMSVMDNMLVAASDQPGERLRSLLLRPGTVRHRERAARERAEGLLESFELTRVADDYASTLSGGQRKLLELARAVMSRPRLLMLDEPLAGINPTLGRRVLEHMQRLRAAGITILFIEHDLEAVMNHSDRVVVMGQGRVIAAGEPHVVRADRAVIDAYLGGVDAAA